MEEPPDWGAFFVGEKNTPEFGGVSEEDKIKYFENCPAPAPSPSRS